MFACLVVTWPTRGLGFKANAFLLKVFLLAMSMANRPRRHAANDLSSRDVLRHNGVGCHDNVVPDLDGTDNDGTGPDEHAVAEAGGCPLGLARPCLAPVAAQCNALLDPRV